MKQFKIKSRPAANHSTVSSTTTRQEVDRLAKLLTEHISKDPKKAARVFEAWLQGKPKTQAKKKAA